MEVQRQYSISCLCQPHSTSCSSSDRLQINKVLFLKHSLPHMSNIQATYYNCELAETPSQFAGRTTLSSLTFLLLLSFTVSLSFKVASGGSWQHIPPFHDQAALSMLPVHNRGCNIQQCSAQAALMPEAQN